jgi:hypothetical protein
MSNPPSVLPPNPYFNGIIYNPSDYLSISGNTVLTYAQASVLFIQKTIADTVTGITDFVNGITTSSILAKTISATCNLWTNATGVINIGTLNGRSAIIHIGDGDNNLSGSGVHINNGLNTASNVQILNGTGSTGIINLGSATSTTNVNCPLTLTYNPSAITVQNQLGYRITPTVGTTTLTLSNTWYNLYQASCPIGIYLITANVYFNTPGNFAALTINTTLAVDTNCYVVTNYGIGSCIQITRVVNSNIDGTQTWILGGLAFTAGCTVGSVRFNVYRIG